MITREILDAACGAYFVNRRRSSGEDGFEATPPTRLEIHLACG